jgi:hypothetical protein
MDHMIGLVTYVVGRPGTTSAPSGASGFTNGVGTQVQFANPYGCTVDSNGITFIADRDNHVIRKMVTSGEQHCYKL